MKKTKRLLALALALGMMAGLTACGGSGKTESQPAAAGTSAGDTGNAPAGGASHYVNDEGKVVVNLQRTEGMQSLNVWNYTSGPNYAFAEMVFDALYVSDHGGNCKPCICTGYDLSED